MPYIETSAENGQNVSKAVELLLELVMVRMAATVDETMRLAQQNDSLTLHEEVPAPQNTCNC